MCKLFFMSNKILGDENFFYHFIKFNGWKEIDEQAISLTIKCARTGNVKKKVCAHSCPVI